MDELKAFRDKKENSLKFIEGRATNTRLMGVMGVIAIFVDENNNRITHIYHLDFEDSGIDGYDEYKNASNDEINSRLIRVIGGLGGYLVPINFDELRYLLKSSYNVNQESTSPELLNNYNSFINNSFELDSESKVRMMNKICDKILLPEQIINYFIMRIVGNDDDGIEFLTRNAEIDKNSFNSNEQSTLIKNEVRLLDSFENREIYEVESLIDYKNKYMMIISTIEVFDDGKNVWINSFEVLRNMVISSKEAFLNLNKKEYLAIYSVVSEGFRNYFYFKKPELMMNIHKNGSLYTEFNINNDHVKCSSYYLNGDIFAVYYITDSDQLIISTFDEKNLDLINEFFEKNGFDNYLEYEGDYEIDSSIIYEFVNSNYENFYEFINMT